MDNKRLVSLFKQLLYIRRVEEKIVELYPEQEMRCPVHLSIGQEAIAVGVSANLETKDMVFSNHRCHAHYLAKGGDLKKFFAEIYGKKTGCSKGRGGSMHLVDLDENFLGSTPVVGGTIPIAVGTAFSSWFKNENKISVIYLGDGATEEGIFHESLNFAKLKNLPVLFVCENNLYSVYTPLNERQPKRSISDIPKAHGLDCYTADGNNVAEVYETSKKAIEKIRLGNGPAFIGLPTYRWREHCGPNYDNNIGYRTQEEFEEWKKKDPVEKLKKELLDKKILSENDLRTLESDINKKITEAVKFGKESPFPDKKELNKFIYAD